MLGVLVLMGVLGVAMGEAHTVAPSITEKLFFFETFNQGNPFESGKWKLSSKSKYASQPVLVKPANSPAIGFEHDNGVHLSQDMKYYGFGSKFPIPLDMKEKKELVIQYEVKLQETLHCGGAYIKLPRVLPGADFDIDQLDSDTPYAIMFGPDKCGTSNNKVHFIVQTQNPVSSEWQENHFNDTAPVKMDKRTHLYTLVIRDDNTFEMFVDKKPSKKGDLMTHMIPSINPPAEIEDPTDEKPDDWVDDEQIDDPEASKPDDWDESAPRTIPDVNAVKPDGWLDDAPAMIPDPSASKPVDWDDEEDGEWESPEIENPACAKVGCGEWAPPTVKNPAYKGKWIAPKVANPAFIGVWKPRTIPNKNYFFDPTPALNLAPMAGLVVEVWTVNGGIMMDNFVVAHSLEDAFAFADATFGPKHKSESKGEKKEKKEQTERARNKAKEQGSTKEKFEAYVAEYVELVVDYATTNPVQALVSALAIIFGVAILLPRGGKKDEEPAAAGGSEQVQDAEPSAAAAGDGDVQDEPSSPAKGDAKKNE